ncbi:hypothetical protein ACLMJK_007968 [Lecanora helva]
MSDQGIMLQWSLDKTSRDVVGVARGILEAATTDDVQVLAMLACENFGAIVAMSPESCHKAFLLCNRSHKSAMISFIKVQVGYRKGDCGWQLAQSDAGLRFLGLAACLISLGSWDGAVILHNLIYSTASDKRLVPTSQHLKKLLQALESRLSTSGFTESAIGWALIFSNELYGSPEAQSLEKAEDKLNYTMTPPNNVVCELTKGLSQLARVGEQLQKIEIVTTSEHAAWLVAFIKWCLGRPPVIILKGNRPLAPETDNNIIVRLAKRGTELRMNTFDCIGNIKNLVATDKLPRVPFSGMVDVRTFGLATLNRHFGHPDEPKYRACLQALPHACKSARRRMKVIGDSIRAHWRYNDVPDPEEWRSSSTQLFKGDAFPPLGQISRALHNYTGNSSEKAPLSLRELPDIEYLGHLPSVSLVRKKIKSTCPCHDCQMTNPSPNYKCEYDRFIDQICECVAHVMAISLLHSNDPKGVQVFFGSEISKMTISNIVLTVKQHPIDINFHLSDILGFVIPMLGHQPPRVATWMMSSWHDQTIFPRIFSNETLQKEEILALECIPGAIIRGEEYFNNVMVSPICDDWKFEARTDIDDEDHPLSEQRTRIKDAIVPKNLFKEFQLQWMVEIRDTAILTSLTMPQLHGIPIRNPRRIWDAALDSVFVDCSHDPATPYHPQSLNTWDLQPVDPRRQKWDHPDVGIVQSYQNEPVRCFTLTSGHPAIVRMQACLNCCIECSELVPDRYVIV